MQEKIIVVKFHAINWTRGEFAYFNLLPLSDYRDLETGWSNGRTLHHLSKYKGKTIRIEHEYGRNAKVNEEHLQLLSVTLEFLSDFPILDRSISPLMLRILQQPTFHREFESV